MSNPVAPRELELLLAEIPPSRLTTIVDVGANPVHAPPYRMLRDLGACRIVGFEPEARAFAELEATKQLNESNFNLAVGDGQTRQLHLYRYPMMTSIFQPYLPGFRAVGWEPIAELRGSVMPKTEALDDLPDLPAFDLLKIDAQGAEKIVFHGARRVLSGAVAVIVELRYLRLYQDEPMLGEIDSELLRQGFGLHKFLFNKSRMLAHSQTDRVQTVRMADQLIDGDAVYLRNIAEPAKLSVDQLKHLAILGSGVFQSHSLVLYCVDELVRRGAAPADLATRYVDVLPSHLRRETGE